MWVAANARRTHRHVPNFSLSVLHRESSGTPRLSVLLCDNEYRKLQNKYGFRCGSDSQHLHTRFVVKRSVSKLTTQACLGPVPADVLLLTAKRSPSLLFAVSSTLCRALNGMFALYQIIACLIMTHNRQAIQRR